MQEKLIELKTRLMEASDLQSAQALLDWDQSTYMPPGGGPARARQGALLARIAQEKATDPEVGRLLDALRPYEESLPYDSDDASLIRVARRSYERQVKVPPALLEQVYQNGAEAFNAWAAARPENNFKAVQPYLERTLELSRRLADCFPGYEHIADPLIDYTDYGMKATSVRALFAELRRELLPIVKAVTEQPLADEACLRQHFPEAQQRAFGEAIITRLGYDFKRGRQDKAPHPFMTKFSLGDVRITTRFNENDLSDGLFSTIHESGHAMYEQGINLAYEGSPLGGGASSGVHESQSRLWENVVGRSRGFWEYFYPQLQAAFPAQLRSVTLDTFYRAINKVERSLIRTDADELTYNLHVMIRFELELLLLEGNLEVKDLPEAWHNRYLANLGLRAPDDRNGVLQDVHWYSGIIGGVFQGYTLGNVMGAQFYAAALNARPEIPEQVRQGQFDTLRGWLTENVYRHGRKFTAAELAQRAAGQEINIEPYIAYLKGKYGELYQL